MRVPGISAIFHDPAAALVVHGETVAAAEEERFSRRKHGKRPVPFAAWELPELSAAWCRQRVGRPLPPGAPHRGRLRRVQERSGPQRLLTDWDSLPQEVTACASR